MRSAKTVMWPPRWSASTPPIAACTTSCSLASSFSGEVLAILVLLTILALFPDIVLFLPRLVYGS